jgi:hypothetical protein
MSTIENEANNHTDGTRRRIIVYAVVLAAVFLIGLVPMWLVARSRGAERDAAQRDLKLCRLENSLSAAAVESRRGEYERARQEVSDFFTALRGHVDGESSDLTTTQKDGLRSLMNQRDDLITLLARSDPASADRLSELYVSFRKAMGSG